MVVGAFWWFATRGKETPFFARAGSGRGTRGVLTGGGRVPLDRVALIVRRAQVAGQMANPFARPRLVRHGVKCGASAGALGCQILGIASFAMRVLFTSNRRGGGGPLSVRVGKRVGLGVRALDGGEWKHAWRVRGPDARSACVPRVGRGLSRSGRVLSQSSFLSRFSPYAFLLAGHRQRGLGPLRRPEERHHSSTQAPSTHLRACRRSSPSSSRPWSHRAPRRTKAETGAKVALRPLPLRGIAPFKASVKRLLTPPHGRVSRVRVDRAPSSTSSPERGFKSERADASAAKSTAKSHQR